MTATPPEDPTSQPGASTPPGAYPPPPAGAYPPPAAGAPAPGAPLSDSDQRLWATLAHAGGIVIGFVAPLIVWLIYRGRGPFVEDQAKEALNFQILVVIASFVSGLLTLVLLGFVLLPLIGIANLIFCILAAVAANRGETYRYPLNWRIIK